MSQYTHLIAALLKAADYICNDGTCLSTREADDLIITLREHAATLRQQAARVDDACRDAWFAVCDALSEVDPEWMMHGPVGVEAAVATIRALSAQPAERQGEAVAWQTLGENGQWFNISKTEYWTLKNANVGQQRPLYTHPAAPMGVPDGDAAIGRAYKRWYAAAKGFRNVVADAAHAMILSEAERIAAAPSAPQGVE